MLNVEGWMLAYLVNAVWQVPVVFGVCWVAARLARGLGVGVEHRVWVAGMVAGGLLPGLPGGLWQAFLRLVQGGAGGEGDGVRVVFGAGVARGGWGMSDGVLRGVAAVFGLVVVYFAVRLGWRVWQTLRMGRRAEPVTLQGEAAVLWEELAGRFGCEGVGLAVSDEVAGPVTVGGRMLVPVGFLERVEVRDLEAVLAHEFAHVRRGDFWKNLGYEAMVLGVAWHPALWALRRRVGASREMVCDAAAVEVVGEVAGGEGYARSLLRLAAMLALEGPGTAEGVHAIGMLDAHLFERRVMRLMERKTEMGGVRRAMVLAACVGMGVVAGGASVALRVGAPVLAAGASAKVSGGVMAGHLLKKVDPVYPRDAKVQGAVVLSAVIGKDGTVEKLQVVSGPVMLQTSALDAVRQWVYKPYLLNGEPVEVETTIQVNYALTK